MCIRDRFRAGPGALCGPLCAARMQRVQYNKNSPSPQGAPCAACLLYTSNSQTQGQAPDVTIGVTVDSEDFDKPILAVCSLYPDVRDA